MRVSALLGAAGVGLGAFGAHGLKQILEQNGTTATWQTAVLYHLVHAVVLLFAAMHFRRSAGPWFCFAAGIVIFSGTLYLLAITGIKWLGAITPLGGISFLAGWLWLALKPASLSSGNE